MLEVNFSEKELAQNKAVVVLVDEGLKLDQTLLGMDQKYHGLISKTIQSSSIFEGKFGQTKSHSFIEKDGELKTLIILGLGKESEVKSSTLEEIGGIVLACALKFKVSSVSVKIPGTIESFRRDEIAALIASGAMLASYRFDKYFTKQKDDEKFRVEKIELTVDSLPAAEKLFMPKKAVAKAVFFARNLVSEPANILYPDSYAEEIIAHLEPLGIEIEVLGEREMKNLGMGALLGVGQGSQNESKLVIMKYEGASSEEAPIVLVGKGVTFDTGGISIKSAGNMHEMKYDMAGSATVVGVVKALALREAKVNIVGVVGLVENMPGGNAQRPGDVVTTMSGQTAEVLNTDAEGRLVLADAIWYAQEKFSPKCVIDIATLTGAIVVALGNTYAGCFANDDNLVRQLIEAGNKVNEKLWRMPLHPDYDKMIKSDIADMANIGSERGAAGSSTAAHFIARFIKEGVAWAHLDIAGMAWDKKGSALTPRGATGFGIRLIDQLVRDYYEQ